MEIKQLNNNKKKTKIVKHRICKLKTINIQDFLDFKTRKIRLYNNYYSNVHVCNIGNDGLR